MLNHNKKIKLTTQLSLLSLLVIGAVFSAQATDSINSLRLSNWQGVFYFQSQQPTEGSEQKDTSKVKNKETLVKNNETQESVQKTDDTKKSIIVEKEHAEGKCGG